MFILTDKLLYGIGNKLRRFSFHLNEKLNGDSFTWSFVPDAIYKAGDFLAWDCTRKLSQFRYQK